MLSIGVPSVVIDWAVSHIWIRLKKANEKDGKKGFGGSIGHSFILFTPVYKEQGIYHALVGREQAAMAVELGLPNGEVNSTVLPAHLRRLVSHWSEEKSSSGGPNHMVVRVRYRLVSRKGRDIIEDRDKAKSILGGGAVQSESV